MNTFDSLFGFLAPRDDGHPRPIEHDAEWIECPDCGQFQALPRRRGKFDRVCIRCNASFGTGKAALDVLLAVSLAMFLTFIAANMAPQLGTFIEGQHATVTIAAASEGLFKQDMIFLGIFVSALTLLVPVAHMVLQGKVLFYLWIGHRPPRLAQLFLWSEKLRPWAMLDVFLLGIFITISKLRSMSQVQMLPGLWALGILVALYVAFSAYIDRQKIWDLIMPPPSPGLQAKRKQWVGCLACGLLHETDGHFSTRGERCDRCETPLHHRKPNSIQKTWALVVSGFVLYIPANLLPVMDVTALGREHPSTIMEGVRQLWTGNDWPYAVLVFVASIVIPLFKLMGLTAFLLTYHLRNQTCLIVCTKFYRLFDKIGRWSVLDIFVAAILAALVDFNDLALITPGPGLMPFAGVVIVTMMAVSSFDPRLMWDAAEQRDD